MSDGERQWSRGDVYILGVEYLRGGKKIIMYLHIKERSPRLLLLLGVIVFQLASGLVVLLGV